MFDSLFTYPAVLRRHQEGPLAPERAAYLHSLAERGCARSTLRRRAVFCLVVAEALDRVASETLGAADIDALASASAAQRVAAGRAAAPRWPRWQFRAVAVELVASMGRLRAPSSAASPHHARVEDFIAAQMERWPSAATQRARRWQVYAFLTYLDERGLSLESVRPEDVDAYFQHVGPRWRRASIRDADLAEGPGHAVTREVSRYVAKIDPAGQQDRGRRASSPHNGGRHITHPAPAVGGGGEPLMRAACRTRSSPLVARSRPCVRRASVSIAFPLASPLPSIDSAALCCPALFADFPGTTKLSDFPRPFITAFSPRGSRCGPRQLAPPWPDVGSPSSRSKRFHACTGSSTARGLSKSRDDDLSSVAFRFSSQRRHPDCVISRLDGWPACAPVKRFDCDLAVAAA